MSERQLYHLRRIGPPATKPGVADVMDFERVTYMIGRSPTMVDYVLDSRDNMRSMYISRCHARVVRQTGNKHRLFDDSLNGIFVNNIKIAGSCVLQEGDRVTFGHPTGTKLPPGVWMRQPDSEYQFIFEECICNHGSRDGKEKVSQDHSQVPFTDSTASKDVPNISEEEKKKIEGELNMLKQRKQEKLERQKEKEKRMKQVEEEKERLKKIKYEKKKEEKKKEKVSFAQMEAKLIQMDIEIKRSLQRTGNADVEKCIAIMEELEALPVNQIILKKNPDIMNTIKKCQKYKGSEQIMKKAEHIYRKFRQYYLMSDGENTIKEIFKTKSKDCLDTQKDSPSDKSGTSGVDNKENTKDGTNTNTLIAYTTISVGLVPGLGLINDKEHEPRTERTDKVNRNTEISSDARDKDDEVDDYDPVTSAKNIKSNSEMVMGTTDAVPNKESKFVNGEDDFGNYDHLNNGPVVKEGESEMDTTENETEFDDMSPSDPHISSADNGTERDEMDLAEDRDLDERLASLAKTSDLLHSTAQAVVDFKDEADDVLENEVFRTPLTNKTNVLKKTRREERRKTRSFTSEDVKNLRQDYEASQQAGSSNAAVTAAESEIQEPTIFGQTEVQYNSSNSEATIGNITEDKTTDSELTSVEPSKESYTMTDMQNRILYSTTAVSEEQSNHSKNSESHNPIIDTETSLISVMDESERGESLMCRAKLSDESENYNKHANVGNEIMQSPLLQEAQKIYDMVKDLNKKINQTQNQEKDCSKKLFVEKSEVCSLSAVNDNHIDVANVTDAGIQTSQTLYDSNDNKLCYDTSSPTKDVMIQTSLTSITSKNSELTEILSTENVEVCQNSVSVLSSQSSLSETSSSQISVSDGNLSTEMETDQSDISEAKTIVIEVFSDSTNQHLIANELSNYSCDRSQTGKSQLLLDQTIDGDFDNLETESRGISESEMEISVTEGDHEVEVHNNIENNRSEESTLGMVSEELEQNKIDSANNVENIGSIEQRHKPIKGMVVKGTSGFVDSKNNSATESSAESKCAIYKTCEFEEVCKFDQEVETGEKHLEQEYTCNSPMENNYIEESIESPPVLGKGMESTPERDSKNASEQEMLRDENIHSSANDDNVLSEKSFKSQSEYVKAAVDFNIIVSLPDNQIKGMSSAKDIGSVSVSETEFPDIYSKNAAVKTDTLVGMEIDIKESGTEHTELNFERVTYNHKKKQNSSLDTYQHNIVHSQCTLCENGKEELKDCEIVLNGTNSDKCSNMSTVEEDYIFKTPEKGFISQENNSVDTSVNNSTCHEMSSCIDSENDFNLTTGLEVIAISLLSKDETESDKHILKSKETKKPFLQDSYAMSIENQDEPYLLDKDDNSSYKDNRLDHMELEGKDELLMEESNMNEVSVKLKLNEEKATNRKRKHAGICQDVDNNFELPIKKLTIIQTTGIGKGESFAEYADTKDKKTQLKRGLSNFFQFRDKYNKLKAISPRKIRKQNVGKIVKHFFSSWFHTKQSYNLLKPESNVFMPNIETAVEGKCIRLECDETSANETKVMEDISMESEDKIAQVVSESAEEKWKQKMECEILCQTAKSVDDNVSSPHSASLIESENVYDLDQAEPQVELIDSSADLPIKEKPTSEIDSSQNSDVTVGNVTCLVRSSDVSIIDNSVCYSDSETDLGYEFLLKRAAETCVEDLKYKPLSPDPASDIEMQDDHNSFHLETISINDKTINYEQTASPVLIGDNCDNKSSTHYNDKIKVSSNIKTEESNVCDASCDIKPDKLNLSGFITQDAIQTEMFEDTSLLKVKTEEAVAADEDNNGNGDKEKVSGGDEHDGKNKDVDEDYEKNNDVDVDDGKNNDVDEDDGKNNYVDKDDEKNNDVDDEMNNDVDDEMNNDVDEDDGKNNDVNKDDEKNNYVAGDYEKNNAVDKEEEKNNDVNEDDEKNNYVAGDYEKNNAVDKEDEKNNNVNEDDEKTNDVGEEGEENNDVDKEDDSDDKKVIDASDKNIECIDTCNDNSEEVDENVKVIDWDENDMMVIEVDDETSKDIDFSGNKDKSIGNSDDHSEKCDVDVNDKDSDRDDKVNDCDDTSEEFDVDENNIDNDDRDDKKEVDASDKNSECIDICNDNSEDFEVDENMKDIDRDENDKMVVEVDETSKDIDISDNNNIGIDNSDDRSEECDIDENDKDSNGDDKFIDCDDTSEEFDFDENNIDNSDRDDKKEIGESVKNSDFKVESMKDIDRDEDDNDKKVIKVNEETSDNIDISDNNSKDIDDSEETSEDIDISDNNYKGIESEETDDDIDISDAISECNDNRDYNSEECDVDENDEENDGDDDEEDKVIDCHDDDTSDDFDDNDKDNDGYDKADEDFDDSNYDTKSSDLNDDNERREEAANDKKFQEKRKPLENQDDDTEDSISDCAALGKVTLEEDSAKESSIKNKQDSVEASVEDRKTMPSMLAVEQLSCRFSDTDDDDDDEFVSPVIDYSHLDSDSGDDLQCGQLDNTKHGSENVHKDSIELEKVESDMSDCSPEVDLQFQDNEAHHIDDDSDWNESDNHGVLIETEESSIESCLDHEETGLEEESYQNRNCDKQSSSNIDNYTEIRVRTPGKRKCCFEEIMSPKLAKYDNKGEVLSETLCTSPSTNEKASFKTPKSKLKENQKNLCESPGDFCSTQMLCSSQQPDLNDITLSQVPVVTKQLEIKSIDKSRSAAMRSKARAILARLKAKKEQVLQQSSTTEDNDIVTSSQEDLQSGQTERTEAQVSLIKDEQNLQSVQRIISDLKLAFETSSLKDNARIQAWRQELLGIEQKVEGPKTVIAVVGDTGAGKSSLMNALLDHRSVLPTSGIRACTAVVVEVIQNNNSDMLEADIEFLQRREWFDELEQLIKDLSSVDGTVRKGMPDPTSDTYVSYCKVKAVYGRIDKVEALSGMTTITHWLGRTRTVRSHDPEDFRQQVERFIQTKDHDAGKQYWPIVKHVRLRLPNCGVCSSGAVLVDLPGVRDSNAARDKIAKEYLKNCTAVWVVAAIHRAIDDKTAKNLLGENFRRQLLMDGQYGSVAFICSKTDVLVPSEIMKDLRLDGETKEMQSKIADMEAMKAGLEREIYTLQKENKKSVQLTKTLQKEVEEIRSSVQEILTLLDPAEVNKEQTEDVGVIEEFQEEMKTKEIEIVEKEKSVELNRERIQECQREINELETKLSVDRRKIAAVCAKARNEYSTREIKKDFKAGLREMKRQAGVDVNEEEEEEMDYNEEEDNGSSADNLQVFCCSATEYQKMKNISTDDGPPHVFSCVEDTQIPLLRNYVHEMTSVRKRQGVERLIRSLGRFVFDLQNYTAGNMTVSKYSRLNAKSAIDVFVTKCRTAMVPVIESFSNDIEDAFEGSIKKKLEEGATTAENEASNTCSLWGSKRNSERACESATGRKSVGLHWGTYRATVSREGIYKSPSYGQINFNEDLTDPIYKCLTIVWDRVFSGLLWRASEKAKTNIMKKLSDFCQEICLELIQHEVPEERGARVCSQLLGSATNKLNEMIAELKQLVTDKQREISRIITPHVQGCLSPAYKVCGMERGPGMFQRIKDYLSGGIDKQKPRMFDSASKELMNELLALKEEVVQCMRTVSNILLSDLKTAFEPLWEAPANYRTLQTHLKQPLFTACTAVREVYRQAGLTNTEETSLAVVAVPSCTEPPASNYINQNSAIVSVVKSSSSSVLALPSTLNTSHCHAVSLLSGQRYSRLDMRVPADGSVQELEQLRIKQEPEGMYSRTADEGVNRIRVVQVKQEYTCTEFDTNASVSGFGQHTIQSLSEGKLELLPVETNQSNHQGPSSLHHTPHNFHQDTPRLHPITPSIYLEPSRLQSIPPSIQPDRPRLLPEETTMNKSSLSKLPSMSEKGVSVNEGNKSVKEGNKSVNEGNKSLNEGNKSVTHSNKSATQGNNLKSPRVLLETIPVNKSRQSNCAVSSTVQLTSNQNRLPSSSCASHLESSHKLKKEACIDKHTTSVKKDSQTKPSQTVSETLSSKYKEKKSETAPLHTPEKRKRKQNKGFYDPLEILSEGFDSSSDSESDSGVIKKAKKFRGTEASKANSIRSENNDKNSHKSSKSDMFKGTAVKTEPKKGRTVRASLSLSRKLTPNKANSHVNSPLLERTEIKAEPEDYEDGYFRRRKKPKVSGFIDLTEDSD